jgi:CheY-like chemotaxis protein
MRILLVEDDDNKTRQLLEFFANDLVECEVITRKSFHSGLTEIIKEPFDLILLDMSMPTYDRSPENPKSRFRHFAGRDILFEMLRRKINIKTIVVTQFGNFGEGKDAIDGDQLHENLKGEFPSVYLGMVHFNAALSNWKNELLLLIKKNINKEV